MPNQGERLSRDDSWSRNKRYLGTGTPGADRNGHEKFITFSAEVPPEIADLLMETQRKSLGVNWDGYSGRPINATRANLVRAALHLWLETLDPEKSDSAEGAIDASATDLPVWLCLEAGSNGD